MVPYEELAERFEDVMGSNPFRCVEREDFSVANDLPDVTHGTKERYASDCRSLANRLRAELASGSFSSDALLDLELAERWLGAEALETDTPIDGTPRHAVLPSALLDLLGLTPHYLERDTRSKSEIVEGVIRRFGALEGYLAQELFRLDKPVAVWVKRELEAAQDFKSVAGAVRQFAREAGFQNMVTLDETLNHASDTVGRYMVRLADMPTRDALSIGTRATENLFHLRGIDVPVAEIYRLASVRLQESVEELRSLSGPFFSNHSLGIGAVLALAEELKVRFAYEQGTVVAQARILAEKAQKFAYDCGLVVPLEDAEGKVESVPGYLKPVVPIAAMFPPGPFGKGTRRSTYYVNEFPGIEQALNRLSLPAITAHELVPGHHQQLTRASRHPSKIRAWISPMDLAEGWTTWVAEELLPAEGYVGDAHLRKEERFMTLIDGLRLPARVCFVLTCLTGDRAYLKNPLGVTADSKNLIDASVQLYRGLTGFAEARARGDVENFSTLGPYGSLYLVGNHLLKEIDLAAQAKQGSSFKRPDLLEAILSEGNVPVSFLNRALKEKGVI